MNFIVALRFMQEWTSKKTQSKAYHQVTATHTP